MNRSLKMYSVLMTVMLMITIIFASNVLGGAPDNKYPKLVIKPSSPVEGDFVKMKLLLGMALNKCKAPTYGNEKVNITPLNTTSYPTVYIIDLKYTEIYKTILCPNIKDPYEYGPEFSVGELKVGKYRVMDGKTLVGTFNVTKKGATVSGRVLEDTSPTKEVKLLANVSVYLKSQYAILENEPEYFKKYQDKSGLYIPWPGYGIIDSTKTDSKGLFKFSNVVPNSHYQLLFVSKYHQSHTLYLYVRSDTSMTVELLPLGASSSITGTVLQYCLHEENCVTKPLPGCSVSVLLPVYFDPNPGMKNADIKETSQDLVRPIQYKSYRAITDKNGRYAIKEIQITSSNQIVSVHARKKGYAPETKSVELKRNVTSLVDFKLQKEYTNIGSVTVDGIVYTVATDKGTYKPSESISVRYTVLNKSNKVVTYRFTSGCQFDMMMKTTDGKTVYQYLKNRGCTDDLTKIVLEPGKQKVMHFPAVSLPKSLTTLYPQVNKEPKLIVSAQLTEHKASIASVGIKIALPVIPTAIHSLLSSEKQPSMKILSHSTELVFQLNADQYLSITAVTLDGRKLNGLSVRRLFTSGTHSLPLTGRAKGTILLRVKGEDFTQQQKLVLP